MKERPIIFNTSLEITDVRVEMVQEIDNDSAIKEGIIVESGLENGINNLAKARFADLWDSIYKNWDKSPWVWVIEFKRIER